MYAIIKWTYKWVCRFRVNQNSFSFIEIFLVLGELYPHFPTHRHTHVCVRAHMRVCTQFIFYRRVKTGKENCLESVKCRWCEIWPNSIMCFIWPRNNLIIIILQIWVVIKSVHQCIWCLWNFLYAFHYINIWCILGRINCCKYVS